MRAMRMQTSTSNSGINSPRGESALARHVTGGSPLASNCPHGQFPHAFAPPESCARSVEFAQLDSPRGEFALPSRNISLAPPSLVASLTAAPPRATFPRVDACKAVTGTSSRGASRERAGDGVSPVTVASDEDHPRAADRNGVRRSRLGRVAPRDRAGARCARQGGGREAGAKLGGTANLFAPTVKFTVGRFLFFGAEAEHGWIS